MPGALTDSVYLLRFCPEWCDNGRCYFVYSVLSFSIQWILFVFIWHIQMPKMYFKLPWVMKRERLLSKASCAGNYCEEKLAELNILAVVLCVHSCSSPSGSIRCPFPTRQYLRSAPRPMTALLQITLPWILHLETAHTNYINRVPPIDHQQRCKEVIVFASH